MKYRPYASIGSRETPPYILTLMQAFCKDFAQLGYTLRSGGADGADLWSEQGCDQGNGLKEIFLPWKGFQHNNSPLHQIPPKAFQLAASLHPNWGACSQGVRALHARNIQQILGQNLDSPSEFVICWTKGGRDVGGTRTAIVLARAYNIPVHNLFDEVVLCDMCHRCLTELSDKSLKDFHEAAIKADEDSINRALGRLK